MKKTLIAIAALAATSAFAQSSVNLTGRIDHGYSVLSLEDKAGLKTESSNIAAGAWTSNRINVTANEDLGAGMKAQLVWESGIGSLNSAASTSTVRQAFVGLTDAKMGTVQVGSIYTPEYAQSLGVAGTVNGRGFGNAALVLGSSEKKTNTSVHALGAIWNANMVNYVAPKLGAVSLSAQFGSASSSKTNASGSALSADASGDLMGLSANFANGPLNATASYLVENKKAIATGGTAFVAGDANTAPTQYVAAVSAADTKQTNLTLNAIYTIGALKLNGYVASREMTGTTVRKYDTTNVGATYTIGNAAPFVSYSTGKMKDATATLNDLTATQIGVSYAFSKRTNAYLYQSNYKDESATTTNSYKGSQTAVGVAHQF